MYLRQILRAPQVHQHQTVTLSPLPCWKHLTPEARRDRVAELVSAKQQAREVREEALPCSTVDSWPRGVRTFETSVAPELEIRRDGAGARGARGGGDIADGAL